MVGSCLGKALILASLAGAVDRRYAVGVYQLEAAPMRYAIFVLLTAAAAPVFADATAAAGACYSITDADARTVCLAKAHGNSSRCYSVKDAGKRAQCLAETKK